MLFTGMAARPWPKDTLVLRSRVGVLCFGSMIMLTIGWQV